MIDTNLIRLLSWLSPVFPIGGYAYSAGLEQAVASDLVKDQASLKEWLAALLNHGSIWNDAVLLAAAQRRANDANEIAKLAELATALTGAAERHKETLDQGKAFMKAARHWLGEDTPQDDIPLPVAVGLACGKTGIDPLPAPEAYLHAFISNQLQVAIRLSVVGQDGAAKLMSELEKQIAETASRAVSSTLDDLGSAAINAEIASMDHETLQPRLFLS